MSEEFVFGRSLLNNGNEGKHPIPFKTLVGADRQGKIPLYPGGGINTAALLANHYLPFSHNHRFATVKLPGIAAEVTVAVSLSNT